MKEITMHISVSPSKSNADALHVDVDGHRYDLIRHQVASNTPPLAALAADNYWRGDAKGDVSYSVILYPES